MIIIIIVIMIVIMIIMIIIAIKQYGIIMLFLFFNHYGYHHSTFCQKYSHQKMVDDIAIPTSHISNCYLPNPIPSNREDEHWAY